MDDIKWIEEKIVYQSFCMLESQDGSIMYQFTFHFIIDALAALPFYVFAISSSPSSDFDYQCVDFKCAISTQRLHGLLKHTQTQCVAVSSLSTCYRGQM